MSDNHAHPHNHPPPTVLLTRQLHGKILQFSLSVGISIPHGQSRTTTPTPTHDTAPNIRRVFGEQFSLSVGISPPVILLAVFYIIWETPSGL